MLIAQLSNSCTLYNKIRHKYCIYTIKKIVHMDYIVQKDYHQVLFSNVLSHNHHLWHSQLSLQTSEEKNPKSKVLSLIKFSVTLA